MKKDQTNPTSQRKKRLEETEAIINSAEQDDVAEGVQARGNAPVLEDIEKDSPTERPAPVEQESQRGKQDEDQLSIPDVLPVLPLKDTVIYPFAVQPLAVGQERSIHLIDDVMRDDRRLVVLVAQKSVDLDLAGPDDIFKVGTVSRVGRM